MKINLFAESRTHLLCAIDDKGVRFYLVAVGKDDPRCLKKEDGTEFLQVNTHKHEARPHTQINRDQSVIFNRWVGFYSHKSFTIKN